jgi:hypothetical protein
MTGDDSSLRYLRRPRNWPTILRSRAVNALNAAVEPRQPGARLCPGKRGKNGTFPTTSSGAVGMLPEGRGLDRGRERTKNGRRDTEEAA